MKTVIVAKNIVKEFDIPEKQSFVKMVFSPKYKKFRAVDNVSFSISEGESVALLGPNGAGKTTTLKILTGIMYPTSGKALLLGEDPTKRKFDVLRNIGFVMGNKATMNVDLSAMQNYELNKAVYQIEPNHFYRTIDELSDLLDVKSHLQKQVRRLSLGQRMKVELIASILHQPKLLFLDEPTIGLDITSQNTIRAFLKKVHKEYGTTVILTSHNMEDIEQVSERVIVINEGKTVFDDTLEKLKRSFSSKKYIKIIFSVMIDDTLVQKYKQYGLIILQKVDTITLEIDKESQGNVIAAIMSDPNVQDIDIEGVPLSKIMNDVFKRNS
jgi:ABC-2 type transport system ATP-binding protein